MEKLEKNPPENGEIKIIVHSEPVSQQSKTNKKKNFKIRMKHIISEAEYYLSGDVHIDIQWYVHEQKHYESSSAYDVDNIIKPLIDALSGKEGILIDDNQVKAINCCWIDFLEYNKEKIEIIIKFIPYEYIQKRTVYFVEFQNSLCLPVWNEDPPKIQKAFIETYEKSLNYRDDWSKKEKSYYVTKLIMPMQRVFHKSRLNGFIIRKLIDVKKELENT
ncbi:MAG: RusA family crossover junction endodeoxyribonuclease [Bacteroidetes bacterium]|nr:RusA family crossover junction endodeoxyribonuclease [Bacteroidota bacterium]